MRVGPYKLDQPIGRGGMATVWGGVHTRLGTPVAFKFLRPDKNQARGALRFLDETRALARMGHPGIVRIFDAGICSAELAEFLGNVEAQSPYFVMEAVAGGTLRKEAFEDWASTFACVTQLLDALAHAHARDVIHRDIKPANILVDHSGAPRLTDFGISRLARGTAVNERVTGTPSYMAPEQIAGEAVREGPWTDLYAIGCLVYRMVTGSPPFQGTIEEVLRGHVHDRPPELEPVFDVPDGLSDWVMRLLDKDPQARYLRAADAAWALRGLGLAVGRGEGVVRGDGVGRATGHGASAPWNSETLESAALPTLTTILDEPFDFGDLESGSSSVVASPPIREQWRGSSASPRTQLTSSGPGMLPYREPPFRGRLDERDRLWNALFTCASVGRDRTVALTGPPGIGRSTLMKWFGRRAHELGAAHLLVFDGDARSDATHQLVDWWNEVGGERGATAFFASRGHYDDLTEWDVQQIARLAAGHDLEGPALSAIHARWTQRLGVDRVVIYLAQTPDAEPFFRASKAQAPGRRLLVAEHDGLAEGFDVQIDLAPLPRAEIEAIVTGVLGLTNATAKTFADIADGNPATAITLARTAVRENLLAPASKGLELVEGSLETLLDAFEKRWDNLVAELTPAPLGVLQRMAAADATFTRQEVASICEGLGVDTARLLLEASDHALLFSHRDAVHFADPMARRALLESSQFDAADHRAIAAVFEGAPETPRRLAIAALQSCLAGDVGLDQIVAVSERLRRQNHADRGIRLVEDALDSNLGLSADDRRDALVSIAESQLSRQRYAEAASVLDLIDADAETKDVQALKLFFRMRRLEDVSDELLALTPGGLSETAARMVSYLLMDLGKWERARQALDAIDDAYDPPGRLFAYARLEFLQGNWSEAERWATGAAKRFQQTGRTDGAISANDVLASAMLKQGHVDDAIATYRDNLALAKRVGFPSYVMAYNLATCLIESDRLSEEVDVQLEAAVVETIQHDRRDVEHVARSAQVYYAVATGDEKLARHRLEQLADFELGPWLQEDSRDHIARALEGASPELKPDLGALLDRLTTALEE